MNRKNHIILLIIFIITGATQLGSAMRASAAGIEDILPKATSGYAGYYDEWKGVGRREAITWTYDAATKTLTFSGSGGMADNESALNLFDDEGNENTEDFESWMLEELGTWYIWYGETEHVVIGEGITDIGEYAFYNFKRIKDIAIPDSVLCISTGAFMDAWVNSITLPESLKEIGKEAFVDAHMSKSSITIPRSIKKIDRNIFKGVSLKSITIPGSVKKIGAFAFEKAQVKEITIENGVEEIDVGAFRWNNALEEIVFPEFIRFVTYNKSKYDAGEEVLMSCSKLKRVTLPSTITKIPDNFFSYSGLEMITIPPSVKTIGRSAFSGCYWLKKVVISSSVKTVGENAFSHCYWLEKVVIPPSVKTIEKGAFSHCDSLRKVTLPPSLKRIEENTFAHTNLKSIKLPKSLKIIGRAAFEDTPLKNIKLPKSLEKIEGEAFNGTSLKTIEIPQNVKVLGHCNGFGVFSYNKKLKTVKIKSRKLKRVEGAFYDFPSKAVITVPKGKKKSYSEIFYNDGLLSKKVTIKESNK